MSLPFKRRNPAVPLREEKNLDFKNTKLLRLPQSDLQRSSRPSLILMAIPTNGDVMEEIKKGNCSIVTNAESSALVLPESSYTLTTIGTSNSLVVYPSNDSGTSTNPKTTIDEDDTAKSDSNKKAKMDDTQQACRLVQPGGSGSSFLSLTKKQITPEAVQALLAMKTSPSSPGKEGASTNQQQQPPSYTTKELSLALQSSIPEVENAMKSLPCSALPNAANLKFRLWTDEEYWNAKRALVEMLCEEVDAEDEDLPPEQFADLVAQRIVLPEDVVFDDHSDASKKWKKNVAQKMILLGTTTTKTITHRYWDKSKIAEWALQDLVLTSRRPSSNTTWPLEELLSTWQSRLPLLWCNDRVPAPKRTEESEESEAGLPDDSTSSKTTDVATRQALEAMPEVEIFVPESDGKKSSKVDDEDVEMEMVRLKF